MLVFSPFETSYCLHDAVVYIQFICVCVYVCVCVCVCLLRLLVSRSCKYEDTNVRTNCCEHEYVLFPLPTTI